ncbi:prepilin-type N-terminal cleavage/methylation domain-containing protein [Pseudomonas sp. ZM23]|uniref:Prepilin-type N-terminal cleavage/methylation domain-containing protein n=1 Tax=Pseudomonas triclosanedens TaxID=2961893 RepID=A0ABY7A2M6_9PSED|nr:prepilin-type N-terminal cleavage/methylation domain-containing protein [Pseudomonas triclosanedens]MCP8464763.1 prepilin-type N-terminal cleavage/methylation domain-containing protein [Pseudomonas triclosanedens]MCP8470524.1 prepilin-type N-terminal cleavage/methylation domain-containing protein [Pseudomonas triclosanedens]MCP8476330.1 prepilin-type N-terminal cleavage/methylation domain-containing protein [Pseudomonas triclosanedens]WAI51441.1 prepilin-type N-terminal cleavage/methylation 
MSSRSVQSGFTLLEAVVAMTLLVIVGGALLAWLNTGFHSVERMAAVQYRIDASRVALAHLERINPLAQPTGSVRLGPYLLEWKSQPLTSPMPVVGRYSGNPGPYDAVLFRVEARIGEEGHEEVPLFLELPGYQQVRSAQDQGVGGV